jgi:hypothetical protein
MAERMISHGSLLFIAQAFVESRGLKAVCSEEDHLAPLTPGVFFGYD